MLLGTGTPRQRIAPPPPPPTSSPIRTHTFLNMTTRLDCHRKQTINSDAGAEEMQRKALALRCREWEGGSEDGKSVSNGAGSARVAASKRAALPCLRNLASFVSNQGRHVDAEAVLVGNLLDQARACVFFSCSWPVFSFHPRYHAKHGNIHEAFMMLSPPRNSQSRTAKKEKKLIRELDMLASSWPVVVVVLHGVFSIFRCRG